MRARARLTMPFVSTLPRYKATYATRREVDVTAEALQIATDARRVRRGWCNASHAWHARRMPPSHLGTYPALNDVQVASRCDVVGRKDDGVQRHGKLHHELLRRRDSIPCGDPVSVRSRSRLERPLGERQAGASGQGAGREQPRGQVVGSIPSFARVTRGAGTRWCVASHDASSRTPASPP